MFVFRRTLYVDSQDDALQTLGRLLRDAVAHLAPPDSQDEVIVKWPNLEQDKDEDAWRLLASLWSPNELKPPWLLDMTLEVNGWRVAIGIGQQDQSLTVVSEESSWLGPDKKYSLTDYPNVVAQLSTFLVKNLEGYTTNIITLQRGKVQGFVDFLLSSHRELPVLYYADPYGREELKPIWQSLWGLAYVVIPRNREVATTFNYLLPSHPTYDRIIRLYMPGLKPDDPHQSHPYRRFEGTIEEITADLFDRVAQASLRINSGREIAELRRRRDDERRRELIQLRQRALHLEKEQNGNQELQDLLHEYEREITKLQEEVEYREATIQDLQKENKSLREKLHYYRWAETEESAEHEEHQDSTPRLLLYRTVREKLASLLPDEERYWRERVFPKLLEPQQREAQTEALRHISNGSVFVYPRSRTHDGRRLFYYLHGEDVYVCEVFLSSEHKKYEELRTRGFDRNKYKYNDFEEFSQEPLAVLA